MPFIPSLPPPVHDSSIRRYLSIALTACAADLATKEVAVRSLGNDGLFMLTERLALTLVWNTGVAGGASLGPFTGVLNVVITVLALGLVVSVVRAMAAVDSRSILALGLVSGGALGNLSSLVAGPRGVADFLAVRLTDDLTIVANVADLFLWTGALALVPVALKLIRLARAERAQKPMYARTRGSMRSGVQGGDQTRFICTSVTPGRVRSCCSASPMISGPDGQPGDVRLMSTRTALPSTAMSYTRPRSTMLRFSSGSFTRRRASLA